MQTWLQRVANGSGGLAGAGILTGFFLMAGAVPLTGVGLEATLHAAQPQGTAADQPAEKKSDETAEKPSVVDFPLNLIRIQAPDGWSISESGTRKDHAWCILQKDDSKVPRPTIVILCGSEFVTQAPGGSENIVVRARLSSALVAEVSDGATFLAGGPTAAILHATKRTLAWSQDKPEPPYPRVSGQAESAVRRYGKTQYFSWKIEFRDREFRDGATYAVMAGKRAGGPLVAACFDHSDELKKTQALLESILSATYVRERRSRKQATPQD